MKHPVEQLAEMVGGTLDHVTLFSDGHGIATMSMPLPKTHWIYEANADGFYAPPPMPMRMGAEDSRRQEFEQKVRAAGKYAVRAATRGGKEMDFDPDALLRNLLVGLFGYHTLDGLSGDSFANPDPVPPLWPPAGSKENDNG